MIENYFYIWIQSNIYFFSGYAPVIRLKIAISGRHAHIQADKTYIYRQSDY